MKETNSARANTFNMKKVLNFLKPKRIKWQFSYFEPKTDLHLFNDYVQLGSHYEGCREWGLECSFDGGSIGYSKFVKRWELGNNFEDKIKKPGKLEFLRFRFGKPIITIFFVKAARDKAVAATKRYEILGV